MTLPADLLTRFWRPLLSAWAHLNPWTRFGAALVVGALVANAWVSVASLYFVQQNEKKAAHSREIIAQVHNVSFLVLNAESSYRGFIMTGEENFLGPYRDTLQRIEGEADFLEELVAEDPPQAALAGRLKGLIHKAVEASAVGLETARRFGREATAREAAKGKGKLVLDEIRGVSLEMRLEEDERLARRLTETAQSARKAMAAFLISGAALLALLGVVAYLMARDLAHQRESDQALQEQKLLLDSIMANMSEGVVVAGPDGKMLYFNASAERITGMGISASDPSEWSKEYGVFREDRVTVFPPEESPLVKAVQGKAVDGAVQFLRNAANPQGLFVSVNGRPLKDGKGGLVGGLVVFRDITIELEAKEKLGSYTRQLEERNRDLQDFIFVASHDLQEPLRKIQAFGNFLREELGAGLQGTAADHLARIQDASKRMGLLIEDLLQLTRVTTKAKPFESVDLSEVVRDVVSDLEMRVQATKAKISIGELPRVEADPTQLRQVFQNLIGNALKFHKPDQAPVVEVSSTMDPVEGTCRVSVKDDGIGFDMKYAGKVFEIFQRLNGQEYEGTGIGLAVCKKVLERHGGRVTVGSRPGEGTIFEVHLPLRKGTKGGPHGS